jgi:hypothetical protein
LWQVILQEQHLDSLARKRNDSEPFGIVPAISVALLVTFLALRLARHPSTVDDGRFAFHFRANALFAGVALGYLPL